MLVNSPSNPTGQAFSQQDIDIITTFCRRHNITLISDEIYADINFSENHGATPCSASQFNEKILTGGLSKVRIPSHEVIGMEGILTNKILDLFCRRVESRVCDLPQQRVWRKGAIGNISLCF